MSIRLINTKTYAVELFQDGTIPDYAILSHTWGEGSQEVTFQEMTELSKSYNPIKNTVLRAKSGYKKIKRFCELLEERRINWAWVDTCCIDKSSSAELSQQINSMYRWYESAKLCIVFLADYDNNDNNDNNGKRSDTELHKGSDALSECRWFSRGWCLQELIAPTDVKFYDHYWTLIGSKSQRSFRETLSDITTIPEELLTDPKQISSFSIAQKMSWAAHRETKWPEDEAYCLLGIFGINMPLLYGEGAGAFTRLQEEIIKKTNDLSILGFYQRDDASLFAQTTEDFWELGDQTNLQGLFQRYEFSLTNNGLHFPRVELQIDEDRDHYCLNLRCERSNMECVLLLRKVGPNLFAKYAYLGTEHDFERSLREGANYRNFPEDASGSSSGTSASSDRWSRMSRRSSSNDGYDSDSIEAGKSYCTSTRSHRAYTDAASNSNNESIRDRRQEISEVYIITNLSQSLESLYKSISADSIHIIWDDQFGGVGHAIQHVEPSDVWDASRSLFLTMGKIPFEASMAIYPSNVDPHEDTFHSTSPWSHRSHFYLVCGIDKEPGNLPNSPWVRLYRRREWRKWVCSKGKIDGRKHLLGVQRDEDFSKHKRQFRGLLVSAQMREGTDKAFSYYRLELNFENSEYARRMSYKENVL